MIMFLRLTFGGAPGPNEWSILAEPIWDLAIALLHDKKWNPSTLALPSQKLVPPLTRKTLAPLSAQSRLGIGRDLIVDIPINHR